MQKRQFPSAFTVLFVLTLLVAVLTLVLPSGSYQKDNLGLPIEGSYQTSNQQMEVIESEIDQIKADSYLSASDKNKKIQEAEEKLQAAKALTNPQSLWDVFKASIEGFRNTADVIVFVIIIGGFLAIEAKSGTLFSVFGSLVGRLKGREKWSIPILMTFFAIGGTTYGMQEETVAFYPLVVPLMLVSGYNAMTAVMIIVAGSSIGLLGGTLNPFAPGMAANFASVSIVDGMLARIILLVIGIVVGSVFVMRYAEKVKQGKYKDDSVNDSKLRYAKHNLTIEKMNRTQIATFIVFCLTFLVMVIALIPWQAEFNINLFSRLTQALQDNALFNLIIGHALPFGDWYFVEISVLFFIAAIVMALINKLSDNEVVDCFMEGAKDILPVAIIIAVAEGIGVIMVAGNIDSTIIHFGEQILRSASGPAFAFLSYVLFIPLAVLIPSTNALATATIPIMAPLANFVNLSRDVVVVSYVAASGLVQMISPTVGSLMGGLVIAGISYAKYVKRTWKLVLLLAIVSMIVILFSAI